MILIHYKLVYDIGIENSLSKRINNDVIMIKNIVIIGKYKRLKKIIEEGKEEIEVFICHWGVIDRAIYTLNHFDLDELIIITNSLSDYASSTLKKLDLPIKAIFSSNLSDLAMKIASLSSSKSSLMMKRVQTA